MADSFTTMFQKPMRSLSLHHLTAIDLSAAELIRLAAEVECSHVCLFTYQPEDGVRIPVIQDDDISDLRKLMAQMQIEAHAVASFPLLPDTDPARYEAGLERGAFLGATRANMRIVDRDELRVSDKFARFGELCRRLRILPCIEFCGFQYAEALPQALRVIDYAGYGSLTLDALHIVRTGTSWNLVEALDQALIGYVQLCDGPLEGTAMSYEREQRFDRLPPGDGQFPLAQLIQIAPSQLPLSLEVPCQKLRDQGLGPQESVREIVRRTRAYLSEGAYL